MLTLPSTFVRGLPGHAAPKIVDPKINVGSTAAVPVRRMPENLPAPAKILRLVPRRIPWCSGSSCSFVNSSVGGSGIVWSSTCTIPISWQLLLHLQLHISTVSKSHARQFQRTCSTACCFLLYIPLCVTIYTALCWLSNWRTTSFWCTCLASGNYHWAAPFPYIKCAPSPVALWPRSCAEWNGRGLVCLPSPHPATVPELRPRLGCIQPVHPWWPHHLGLSSLETTAPSRAPGERGWHHEEQLQETSYDLGNFDYVQDEKDLGKLGSTSAAIDDGELHRQEMLEERPASQEVMELETEQWLTSPWYACGATGTKSYEPPNPSRATCSTPWMSTWNYVSSMHGTRGTSRTMWTSTRKSFRPSGPNSPWTLVIVVFNEQDRHLFQWIRNGVSTLKECMQVKVSWIYPPQENSHQYCIVKHFLSKGFPYQPWFATGILDAG